MAAVDSCYVNSYKDYIDFINWAKGKTYTTPRGVKIVVSNYIHDWWTEKDFEEKERPIFNSTGHFDNYLYHNCPLNFIQEWLKESYKGEGYCKGNMSEITDEPHIPEYVVSHKVKVLKKGTKYYWKFYHRFHHRWCGCWDISVEDSNGRSLWYNENLDCWILPNENDVWTSSHAHSPSSIKSIIRKILKKWNLPKGCTISVTNRYFFEDWILKTY